MQIGRNHLLQLPPSSRPSLNQAATRLIGVPRLDADVEVISCLGFINHDYHRKNIAELGYAL